MAPSVSPGVKVESLPVALVGGMPSSGSTALVEHFADQSNALLALPETGLACREILGEENFKAKLYAALGPRLGGMASEVKFVGGGGLGLAKGQELFLEKTPENIFRVLRDRRKGVFYPVTMTLRPFEEVVQSLLRRGSRAEEAVSLWFSSALAVNECLHQRHSDDYLVFYGASTNLQEVPVSGHFEGTSLGSLLNSSEPGFLEFLRFAQQSQLLFAWGNFPRVNAGTPGPLDMKAVDDFDLLKPLKTCWSNLTVLAAAQTLWHAISTAEPADWLSQDFDLVGLRLDDFAIR